MDKSHKQIAIEIEQLKSRADSEPNAALIAAKKCATRSAQACYPEGEVQCFVIMSRCLWNEMDYRQGLKLIKKALAKLNSLDTDDFLPEILHLHALHYWGQAKYYSAQQFWINALEQSALVGETECQIEALIGLGNIWRITREFELAKHTHELAATVANHNRINSLEGKARILLAWDHYLLNNFVDMLSTLDGAAEVLKDHHDSTLQAEIWYFRGLALLGLERVEDADAATEKTHSLAIKHDLAWVKAQSYISRSRLELLRKNPKKATELLNNAEQLATTFDNGELLSQICYQQSVVAEECNDSQAALLAFKNYRKYSISMLREQTEKVSGDKAKTSKRQMEQRARKLINRIRAQHEFDSDKPLSKLVSEIYWWEQLVLFKTELKQSNYSVIVIQHNDPCYLEVCAELTHALCNQKDILSRLSSDRLGLLLADKGEAAENIYRILCSMIENYPWQRKGLNKPLPRVSLQDILSFPFTLEQLDEAQQEKHNGSITQ